MEPIAICAAVGTVIVLSTPFTVKRKSFREKYRKLSDQDLALERTKTKHLFIGCSAFSLLAPLILATIFEMIKSPKTSQWLLCLIVLTIFVSIANAFFWWSASVVTEAETKFRNENRT